MQDYGIGNAYAVPACPARAPGQLDVFEVGEVPLIEEANIVEQLAPVEAGACAWSE
jgi:hypothetical protein